ncbi:alpha/beta-hydrolase [Lophiostoma macrostomum CBS 122681]|uniref:Alpha/beta-hydrolase n=1 Tax=Lophiostoma macrostomum CBS 122681 TaxID=1314788 RepID=A0A6A6SQ18_9PLEO|nr:alpha/beta-hydrolase [Lophiostoma macrostomum CBS 122681]
MKPSTSSFTSGLLAVAATATASPLGFAAIPKRQNTTQAINTTFFDISASPELNWIPCYKENIQCTKLTVWLDYEDESAGTTDIAFARYLLSEDAEDLLFNPGGPGESGLNFVLSPTGEETAKKWGYNYVSFDPRGVQLSGPRLSCSPLAQNQSSTLRRRQDEGDLTTQWEQRAQINTDCNDANTNTNAKYVGTSAVVQDIMHFVELQAVARGKAPEEATINYYGVSYGTVIGQTLAAMYPDRIRRVLLDGNVYGEAYYQGWYSTSLDDLAYSIYTFAKLCFEAGTDWCALAEGMSSPDDIQARFDAAVDKLRNDPLQDGETTIDDNAFLKQVLQALYFPRTGNQGLNYSTIAEGVLRVENAGPSNSTTGVEQLKKRDEFPYKNDDEISIITAVDIAGRYPWTTMAGFGMDSFIPPKSQYFPGFEQINTSAPILFINTPADPVTPRSAAYQMSHLFEGSSVIIHNAPGHGYSNAPSACTDALLATYFADGTVPETDTWCEPDVEANYYFGGPDPTESST